MRFPHLPNTMLSIGEVAEATGLSPDVLRVWERRYGVPAPQRLPSGHRRYPASELMRLRMVAEALAKGARPGQALEDDGKIHVSEPLLASLKALDAAGFWRALGLKAALNLQALRGLELGLSALECAGSVGAVDSGESGWAAEQLLDALCRFKGPESGAKVLVFPASEGGRLTGVRVSLVAAAFRIQGIPAMGFQRPLPAPQLAALAEAMHVDRVVVPLALEGRVTAYREAIRGLRSHLPDRIALWICGPGQRRAPRECGVEAYCGVREHHA